MLDREAFRQALFNLILNAKQAMPDGGQLVVRTAAEGDTRGGSPDRHRLRHGRRTRLSQMFEAFFSTKPGGSGLGLPTTQKIIEAHGGRIQRAERSGPRHAVHDRAAGAGAVGGRGISADAE